MYERQQVKYGYVPNYAKVFGHRPEIMGLWADLLAGIRRHIEPRRFELVTSAAALTMLNSYCALAHGKALTKYLPAEEVRRIFAESEREPSSAADAAVFDIAATAAARAFFAKLLDALGAKPDSAFLDMEAGLREALATGRPIDTDAPERVRTTSRGSAA